MVVVKTTSRCNAGCGYCASHKPEEEASVLSLDLTRRVGRELLDHARARGARGVTFLWHGGEPLLLGKSFYADAWSTLCSTPGLAVQHLVQTNLLLLDREWADLLKRFGVHIGTSVDPFGRERIYEDGRPQYPDWLDRFMLASEHGLSVGVVFTVTAAYGHRAVEVYAFLRHLQSLSGKRMGARVNPAHAPGGALAFVAGRREDS